jgi:diadenosine tetraphosphate (Ap4A) HIT family hydrolase
MSSSVSDVLSWEEFYKFSKKRKEYPPKQIDLFNRLIGHTKNFFLISAYGAFSPGYVMLITKELMPSMSMVKDSNLEELKWLISKTKKAIEETYSRDVVYFEHGMCACVGGLDRAHLHFMSVKKNTDKS